MVNGPWSILIRIRMRIRIRIAGRPKQPPSFSKQARGTSTLTPFALFQQASEGVGIPFTLEG